MDIELRELSNIYLQTLKEQEDGAAGEGQNPQQSADIGTHAKSIRYRARRDNVPLPKAFNDYVAKNQLSGSERTALRQRLGFMGEETIVEKKGCNHTKKGEEYPEHGMKGCPVDEQEHKIGGGNLKKLAAKANKRIDADVDGDVDTDDPKSTEMGEFIPSPDGKKKVKTKVRFEHVSWRTELSEYTDVSPMDKTGDKSREKISEKKVKNKIVINPPQGMTEAIEELGGQILEMVEIEEEETGDSKPDAETKKQLAAKEQMMRKQQLLSKQRLQMQKQGKLPTGHMEELSIDQQMKISRDAAKDRKPYQPGDREKQRAAQIRQMVKNSKKDTRTDAQKMTDATGPRPGSRYRGD